MPINDVALKVEENRLVKGDFEGVTKAEAENSVLNKPIPAQGTLLQRSASSPASTEQKRFQEHQELSDLKVS